MRFAKVGVLRAVTLLGLSASALTGCATSPREQGASGVAAKEGALATPCPAPEDGTRCTTAHARAFCSIQVGKDGCLTPARTCVSAAGKVMFVLEEGRQQASLRVSRLRPPSGGSGADLQLHRGERPVSWAILPFTETGDYQIDDTLASPGGSCGRGHPNDTKAGELEVVPPTHPDNP